MISVEAPKGLGDAIYLRAFVLHLLGKGEQVTVFTKWTDVFADLPVTIKPLREMDWHACVHHATAGGEMLGAGVSDFSARCVRAGVTEDVEVRINWRVRNPALLKNIRRLASGKKIFIYQPRKTIKNRSMEIMRPNREAFNAFVASKSDYFRIKLGHPPFCEDDPALACELDMFGKGMIFDTFDICTMGTLFFSEPCFITIIAEAMDKHHVCMLSRASQQSDGWHRNMTPDRIFHKKHLATAVYDDEVNACV